MRFSGGLLLDSNRKLSLVLSCRALRCDLALLRCHDRQSCLSTEVLMFAGHCLGRVRVHHCLWSSARPLRKLNCDLNPRSGILHDPGQEVMGRRLCSRASQLRPREQRQQHVPICQECLDASRAFDHERNRKDCATRPGRTAHANTSRGNYDRRSSRIQHRGCALMILMR